MTNPKENPVPRPQSRGGDPRPQRPVLLDHRKKLRKDEATLKIPHHKKWLALPLSLLIALPVSVQSTIAYIVTQSQLAVNTFKPFDKAGAYGIQEWIGYIGIDRIEGSYFTIMGFPVHLVYQELLNFIG